MSTSIQQRDSGVFSPTDLESCPPSPQSGLPPESPTTKKKQPIPTVEIRGMPIHLISMKQVVAHICSSCQNGVGGWVVTPNLDILRRYKRSASFRSLVVSSSLNVADGMPLVWASRIKGQPVPGRVNGTDLMIELCEAASKSGQSVFFLGGNEGTAEATANELCERFPGLIVAGVLCPEFGFESNIDAVSSIADTLTKAQPDIVFVGLGSPKQDVLVNMLRLKLPKVWWLGVGVSFSFVAGEFVRAPAWAKNNGFEWLYHLFAEPKRLAKRYLFQGIPFLATTFAACLFQSIFSKPTQAQEPQQADSTEM